MVNRDYLMYILIMSAMLIVLDGYKIVRGDVTEGIMGILIDSAVVYCCLKMMRESGD